MGFPVITPVIAALVLTACGQSAPPMPRSNFEKAAKLCDLRATTYIARHKRMLDEPLINFSGEGRPEQAMRCFNRALEAIDPRAMADPASKGSVSYIWEWKR